MIVSPPVHDDRSVYNATRICHNDCPAIGSVETVPFKIGPISADYDLACQNQITVTSRCGPGPHAAAVPQC